MASILSVHACKEHRKQNQGKRAETCSVDSEESSKKRWPLCHELKNEQSLICVQKGEGIQGKGIM